MKKILFSMIIVVLCCFAALGVWVNFNHYVNIKIVGDNKKQFIGLGKEQVLKKFGKPTLFHHMGAIDKDGASHSFETMIYSVLWGKDIVITLKDDVVEEIKIVNTGE